MLALFFILLLHVVQGAYYNEICTSQELLYPNGQQPINISSAIPSQPIISSLQPPNAVQTFSLQPPNALEAPSRPKNTYNSIGISNPGTTYYQPEHDNGGFEPAARFFEYAETPLPNLYNQNSTASTFLSTGASWTNPSGISSAQLLNVPDIPTSPNSTMAPDLKEFKYAPLVRRALKNNMAVDFSCPNFRPSLSPDFIQDIFHVYKDYEPVNWAFIFSITMAEWSLFGDHPHGPESLAYYSFLRILKASGCQQLSSYIAQFSSSDSHMERLIRMLKDIGKGEHLVLDPAMAYQSLLYFYGKYKSRASSDILDAIKSTLADEFVYTNNDSSAASVPLAQNAQIQYYQPQPLNLYALNDTYAHNISRQNTCMVQSAEIPLTQFHYIPGYNSSYGGMGSQSLFNAGITESTSNAPQNIPIRPESLVYSENLAPNTHYQQFQHQEYMANVPPTEYNPLHHSQINSNISSTTQYSPVAGVPHSQLPVTSNYTPSIAHSHIPVNSNYTPSVAAYSQLPVNSNYTNVVAAYSQIPVSANYNPLVAACSQIPVSANNIPSVAAYSQIPVNSIYTPSVAAYSQIPVNSIYTPSVAAYSQLPVNSNYTPSVAAYSQLPVNSNYTNVVAAYSQIPVSANHIPSVAAYSHSSAYIGNQHSAMAQPNHLESPLENLHQQDVNERPIKRRRVGDNY